MNLTIALSTRGDEDLVRIAGAVDFASVPYLRQVVFRLYDAGRRHITIDLSEVQLVDPATLRLLLFLQKQAEQHAGSLRTVGARGVVLTTLEVTGVAKQLHAYDDVDWPA